MELHSADIHQHEMAGRIENDWNLDHQLIKKTTVYATAVIVLLATISYLFADLPPGFSAATAQYIFIVIFLLTGIAHLLIFPKWLPELHTVRGFFYTALIGVLVSVSLLFVFAITGFDAGQLPYAAATAFVLPAALSLCWYYFAAITALNYKAWVIPAGTEPEKRMSLLLNSLVFKVRMKVKEEDKTCHTFPVTLTDKLTMAAMFCRFLYDQKGRIQVQDDAGDQYAWRFYVLRLLGNKPLDPEKSLKENGIKEGDIILIERSRQ